MKVSEVFSAKDANSMLKGGNRIYIMDIEDGRVFVSDGKILLLLPEKQVSPLLARGGWRNERGHLTKILELPDPKEYTSIGVGKSAMVRDRAGGYDYAVNLPNVGEVFVYACSGYKTCAQSRYIKLAARFGMRPWAIDPLKGLGGGPLAKGSKMSLQMIPLSGDGDVLGGVVMPVRMGNE